MKITKNILNDHSKGSKKNYIYTKKNLTTDFNYTKYRFIKE